MELGAEGMLVKQQGDEREGGLAEFPLFLVRAPVKVKKMDPNHAQQPAPTLHHQGNGQQGLSQ